MKVKKIPVPIRVDESLFNLFAHQYEIFSVKNDGRKIALNKRQKTWFWINKNEVCTHLRNMYFDMQKQTISNAAVNTVYELIRSIADTCEDEITAVNGLLQTDTSIIFDIRGTGKYISVTEDEVQTIDKKKARFIFIEEKNCTGVVIPNVTGLTEQYMSVLKTVFGNLKFDVLFAVYLCSLFIRNISHPLLIISGEYGAAKTTFARMIAKIINPYCGDVTPMPKSLDDVATVIHNSYYTAFENISYINRELADLLCLSVTGGSYKKRKLYTDSDVSTLNLHNPISLNGLNLAFPFSDLMDRAIMLELERISPNDRKSEEEVWERFYSYLPDIQGCIFTLLSMAMSKHKNVQIPELPRLADFTRWGYAIAESIEDGLGEEFLRQYRENTCMALKSSAESNPLLTAVSNLMASMEVWEGTATELLAELETVYYSNTINSKLPRSFPTTANVLSRKLNVLQNDLKILGLRISIGRDTNRFISIKKLH